nr:NADH dehydrogenase (ubiquinone) 1 alpha subcomplex 6 [Cryptococcus depauperatus CBS 7841]
MTTIPPRLARVSKSVSSWEEARQASLAAYRVWYRSAPEIVQLYGLHISPSLVRYKIRQDFERNRDSITDLSVMNVMLLKNQQEYQETMNLWKQEVGERVRETWLRIIEPHVMQWFKDFDNPPQPKTFLEKFYASRDDPKQLEPTY